MTTLFEYVPLLSGLLCLGLGSFILTRDAAGAPNRSFFAGMLATAVMEFGTFLAYREGGASPDPAYLQIARGAGAMLPPAWLLFSVAYARVDAGQSRRWRAAVVLAFTASAALFVGSLEPGWLPGAFTAERAGHWGSIVAVLTLAAALANFERVIRSADVPTRWKIKFLLLGIGSILAVNIFVHSQHLLYPLSAADYRHLTSTAIVIGCALASYSLVRHQLLNVDVFISRYFMYSSITVAAVGFYFLVVGITAQAIRTFGGGFSQYLSALFVFLSAVFIVLILFSSRARKKLEVFVARHFYRNRYDYHKEWLGLTGRLGSKLDEADLFPPISEVFKETLWVNRTVLWLCDENEEQFATVAAGAGGGSPFPGDKALVRYLKALDYPVPLEDAGAAGNDPPISREQRDRFLSQGISVLVPLVTGGRLVGVFGLSNTRSGHPFDGEDYDLMQTVARQAATCFLNARLSHNLIRAKELETFHSVSAFIVHDLKNFVSMLSLVLQNAERNLDNPEFRKDALTSISQAVDKMKRMMERLSVLSRKIEVSREPTDINALAREVVSQIKGSLKSRVVEEYLDVPRADIDPAQIRKVLVNLVLNADDANSAAGEVRVKTAAQDGRVVLSVSDDGCGMSEEFVRDRLFHPFATTKSGGFGIGLYQAKEIVQAHGGRIDVETGIGQGSCFRVALPLTEGDR
ncbi:MAG: PEP-CTERM system histidine kinase PrsK [Deltaproteobacteria bacterium]|nr:PEP-CTERM system histidine kinase PrsK [Deltaproteobacteria bacterium]